MKVRQMILLALTLILLTAACAPSTEVPAAEAPAEVEPAAEEPSAENGEEDTEEEQNAPAETGGEIMFSTTDACSLFSEEQVEAAFGKDVQTVSPKSEVIGSECEYDFDEAKQLRVTIYRGDAAKEFFYALIIGAEQSCDGFFDALFDPSMGQGSTYGEDLSTTYLGDQYRDYLNILSTCFYARFEDHSEIGSNVVAAEMIFLNWTSSVALLGNSQLIEIVYSEPYPAEAEEALQAGTDRDSFYAIADPYRDSVLVPYTNAILGLVQEAAQ